MDFPRRRITGGVYTMPVQLTTSPDALGAWAALASAATALLSLVFAIYIYFSNRGLRRPFERPILGLLDGIAVEGTGGTIGYALRINNVGKRPATRIEFRARAAPEKDLGALQRLPDWAPAHDYQPAAEMRLMVWPSVSFALVTMVHVEVKYEDGLSNRSYREAYYLVVFPGKDRPVTAMNRTQRETVEHAWADNWPDPPSS